VRKSESTVNKKYIIQWQIRAVSKQVESAGAKMRIPDTRTVENNGLPVLGLT